MPAKASASRAEKNDVDNMSHWDHSICRLFLSAATGAAVGFTPWNTFKSSAGPDLQPFLDLLLFSRVDFLVRRDDNEPDHVLPGSANEAAQRWDRNRQKNTAMFSRIQTRLNSGPFRPNNRQTKRNCRHSPNDAHDDGKKKDPL